MGEGGHSVKGDICQCDQKRDVTLRRNHWAYAAASYLGNKKVYKFNFLCQKGIDLKFKK